MYFHVPLCLGLFPLEVDHCAGEEVPGLFEVVVPQQLLGEEVVLPGYALVGVEVAGQDVGHAVALVDDAVAGVLVEEGSPGGIELHDLHDLVGAGRQEIPVLLGLRVHLAVKAVELVVLDDLDQPLRVLRVGGVAGFLQAVAPGLVIGDVQVEEKCVAVSVAQEVGVILEGFGRVAVFAEAGFPGVVVLFVVCRALPVVVAFDTEVVVGLDGQIGVAVA